MLFSMYKRSKLTNDDVLELCREMIALQAKHFSTQPFISLQTVKIKEEVRQIEVLNSREMGNKLTDQLRVLDVRRSDINNALASEVESKVRLASFQPEKGQAAKALQSILDATPVQAASAYAHETNQLNVRIRALDTPENRAHLETLEVTPVFDALKAVQDEFEETSTEKNAIESMKIRGTVKSHIDRIKEVIDYILPYLCANVEDDPAQFEAPAKELQEHLITLMGAVQSRETREKR